MRCNSILDAIGKNAAGAAEPHQSGIEPQMYVKADYTNPAGA